MVAGGVQVPAGGVGEPPVPGASGQSAVGGLVAEEGGGRRRLPDGGVSLAPDLGRGVVEAVEDPLDPGVDVLPSTGSTGCGRLWEATAALTGVGAVLGAAA